MTTHDTGRNVTVFFLGSMSNITFWDRITGTASGMEATSIWNRHQEEERMRAAESQRLADQQFRERQQQEEAQRAREYAESQRRNEEAFRRSEDAIRQREQAHWQAGMDRFNQQRIQDVNNALRR